ncbi:MAG: 6,7-dimethyl-8-ribityllumazine synthase [Bacteroidales bacterium]|nr:6,7-dimethyl-8-ribityllumazine synthase [Bacteroidales bacterium]
MATKYHNLSEYDPTSMPDASAMKVGIVVAEWNHEITSSLLEGALSTLTENGVSPENILVRWVPGSFELIYGAKLLAEKAGVDAVIVLGCVVRGETPHFEYICSGVAQGVATLNINYGIPFIFGLLTNNTMQQSIDRAGGIHGNKGDEAAVTAIKMIALNKDTL